MSAPTPAQAASRLVIVTHEFAPFRGGVATYVGETASALHRLGTPVEVWAPDGGNVNAATATRNPLTPSPNDEGVGRGLGRGEILRMADAPAQPLSMKLNTPSPHPSPPLRAGERVSDGWAEGAFLFPVVRLRAGGTLRPKHTWQFARELATRRAELERATVVLASVGAHTAFMLNAAMGRARGRRLVSLLHGSEVLRFSRNPFWRLLAAHFYRRVDRVATVSEFSRLLIAKSFLGALAGEIAIAPGACSAAAARKVAVKPANDGKLRVLTLARIHPRKGQLDVARALGRLPAELRRRVIYQLGGAGDAGYLRQIQRACREGGVALVHFGEIEPAALAETYAQCDIYAMTSRTLARSVEGFGITYLEAGFHGKPVVGYRSGGAAEAVVDGETGLLVGEGDVDALTAEFARLLEDGGLRQRLGAGGQRRAAGFNWDATAKAFQNF